MPYSYKTLKVLEIDFSNSKLEKEHILNFFSFHLSNSNLKKIIFYNINFTFFAHELNIIYSYVDKSSVKIFDLFAKKKQQ